MTTKFKFGEKALMGKEEVTIKVSMKDFSTGKIKYLLENGLKVNEDELTKIGSKPGKDKTPPTVDKELVVLQEEYKKLLETDVPNNKKNDKAWLKTKIDEKKFSIGNDKTPYETLKELNHEQLIALILDKKLEINTEDHGTLEELLIAVCGKMEIEIPE